MMTAKEICQNNPAIFGLSIAGMNQGRLTFTEPDERQLRAAEIDVVEFQRRQEAIRKRTKPAEGDWVHRLDGSFERISVVHGDWHLQVGGYAGSSVYINSNGTGSYSGGCGDVIKHENLVDSGAYKPAACWMFHHQSSGAGRGVNAVLEFKVWKEVG